MLTKTLQSGLFRERTQSGLAILCSFLLLQMDVPLLAQTQQKPDSPVPKEATVNMPADEEVAAKIPPDQLDSLVAPIALYPDPMLAQVLAASTYPLELIQLQQWLARNKNLKDKALADAVANNPGTQAFRAWQLFQR